MTREMFLVLTENKLSFGKLTAEPHQQPIEVLQIMLLSHDPPSFHAGTEPGCGVETGRVPPFPIHTNSIKTN